MEKEPELTEHSSEDSAVGSPAKRILTAFERGTRNIGKVLRKTAGDILRVNDRAEPPVLDGAAREGTDNCPPLASTLFDIECPATAKLLGPPMRSRERVKQWVDQLPPPEQYDLGHHVLIHSLVTQRFPLTIERQCETINDQTAITSQAIMRYRGESEIPVPVKRM